MTTNARFGRATPPLAKKKPHWRELHGERVLDNYYWLRDYFGRGADSIEVLDYLREENEYFDKVMKPAAPLREILFEEMKSRIKEEDSSVPVLKNGYYYYSRTEEEKQYYKFCRRKERIDSPEEVLLDVDEMAEGHSFFSVRGLSVSEDSRYLAFGIDTLSRRQYTIYIKDLVTGKILNDRIFNTEGDPVWANDHKTIFYTSKNPRTLLSQDIFRHILGSNSEEDDLIYHEDDNTNYIGLNKSKNKRYIFIVSEGTLSSEWRMLDADNPENELKIFQKRVGDVLYSAYPGNNKFFILTNKDGSENFKLMECPLETTSSENWQDVIPHRKDVLLEGISEFSSFLAIQERKNGIPLIRIYRPESGETTYINLEEPDYVARIKEGHEYNSIRVRYFFSSLITPASTYDYNTETGNKELKKRLEIGGGFDSDNYVNKRIEATAADGTRIPMSLVYRKGFQKNGNSPLLLYGYGSYGVSVDPVFNREIFSLVDRGFVYAIAHVRGGQEMGRQWYLNGKLNKKKNTFTDFIDCAKYVIKEKYTSADHLFAMGGSAGGWLMGVIINQAPELWKGVAAKVPFVDVVNTMLDENIPLTTNEFDEWGNPQFKEAYDYIKSYSPYENVERKNYPNMLVTSGIHDSQVQYFEPAKWVAKLRDMKTDDNLLLLTTEMDSGHGGASGRFDYLQDVAKIYAFLLFLEGITN